MYEDFILGVNFNFIFLVVIFIRVVGIKMVNFVLEFKRYYNRCYIKGMRI